MLMMLGPATSRQPGGQGVLLVLRLVTNLPSHWQVLNLKQYRYTVTIVHLASMLAVYLCLRQLAAMHMIVGSKLGLCMKCLLCIFCSWQSEIVHAMYVHGIYIV